MEMKLLIPALCLTWNYCVISVLSRSFHWGNLFVVQFPHTRDGRVIFYPLTMSLDAFSVNIRTAYYYYAFDHNVDEQSRLVLLERMRVDPVVFEGLVQPRKTVGKTYAFVAHSDVRRQDLFSLTVQLLSTTLVRSVSEMLVLPVAAFGRTYYLFQPIHLPSVTVVTAQDTQITLNLVKAVVGPHNPMTQETRVLLSLEAYVIYSRCDLLPRPPHGSRIEDTDAFPTSVTSVQPIGIIAGYCVQAGVGSADDRDFSLFMHLPEDCFGREYLIVLPLESVCVSIFFTVETIILYKDVGGVKQSGFLIRWSDNHSYKLNFKEGQNQVAELRSNNTFYCTVAFNGGAGDRHQLAFAASSMIPTGLYCNHYAWRTLQHPTNAWEDVAVFFLQHNESLLVLDERDTNDSWVWHRAGETWRYSFMNLSIGTHQAYTRTGATFGCIVFGVNVTQQNGYMHHVGFIVSKINTSEPSDVTMASGDLVDNDGDQRVDEEMDNGKDDDGDGLVDEDLVYPKTVHGKWGDWEDFKCLATCGVSFWTRVRTCNNPAQSGYGLPCVGVAKFSDVNKTCSTGHICPQDCPFGKYLIDCVGDCSNCENDCNKVTGSCSRCKLGWMDPLHGCKRECPEMTFGFHCTESCSKKCNNHDCLDKIHGTCPVTAHPKDLMFLLPTLLFLPICFLPCFFRRTKDDIPESENAGFILPLELT